MEGRTIGYILEKTKCAFTQYELTQGTPQQKWIKQSTLGKALCVNVTIKKYFSNIVGISFTGGGNRSDRKKQKIYYIQLDQC
jgi:hypothetical protein